MFRPQPISSTDARKYFTQIINKVQYSSKSFVIKSYRHPAVRVVKENYIAVLEEVLGKKTINQILQIAGNDRLFEAEKIEQIKKTLQRRLSGTPRPERRPKPPQPQSQARKPTPPQPKEVPERGSETQKKSQNRQQGGGVLLLSDGKNYQ